MQVMIHDRPHEKRVLHILDDIELGKKYGRVLGFRITDENKEWYNAGDRLRILEYNSNLDISEDKALNQLFLKSSPLNKENAFYFMIQDKAVPINYLSVLWNRYEAFSFEYNFSGKKPMLRRLWAVRGDTSGKAHYILIRSMYSDEKAMFREVKRNGLVE